MLYAASAKRSVWQVLVAAFTRCPDLRTIKPLELMPGKMSAILGLNQYGLDRQAVAPVSKNRVGGHTDSMLLAPLAQSEQGWQQIDTFFGKPVFDFPAIMLTGVALHDPVLDQPGKPVGKDVTSNSKHLEKILEVANTVESGAQDHERPAIAHHLQCGRQAAFPKIVPELVHWHDPIVRQLAIFARQIAQRAITFLVAT
jgi:hypothetical protein